MFNGNFLSTELIEMILTSDRTLDSSQRELICRRLNQVKRALSISNDKTLALFKSIFLSNIREENNMAEMVLFSCLIISSIRFNGEYNFYNSLTIFNRFQNIIKVNLKKDPRTQKIIIDSVIVVNPICWCGINQTLDVIKKWVFKKSKLFDILGINIQQTTFHSSFEREVVNRMSFRATYLENNTHGLYRLPTVSEIQTKRITELNSLFSYDIDGISGIINMNNCNWLKVPIKVAYNKHSSKKICNSSRIIQLNSGFYKLRELYHTHLGSLDISKNERLEFYFFLSHPADYLPEKKLSCLKKHFESCLQSELLDCLRSERLVGYRRFFKNIESNDSKDIQYGYFDDFSLKNLLKMCDLKLFGYKSFIYFELYNCKAIFNNRG